MNNYPQCVYDVLEKIENPPLLDPAILEAYQAATDYRIHGQGPGLRPKFPQYTGPFVSEMTGFGICEAEGLIVQDPHFGHYELTALGRDVLELSTKREPTKEQPGIEHLLDKDQRKILQLAEDPSLNPEEKYLAICRLDSRAEGWTSGKWAEMLSVSDSRVRQIRLKINKGRRKDDD